MPLIVHLGFQMNHIVRCVFDSLVTIIFFIVKLIWLSKIPYQLDHLIENTFLNVRRYY